MVIRRLELRCFRGLDKLTVVPQGNVVVGGEPRAGRSTLLEGLFRVLSPDGARGTLGDDLDFHVRDRAVRPEVEVVLGDLGDDLSQRFFDQLEYWDDEEERLVDELDALDGLEDYEQVVRLCYRARWSVEYRQLGGTGVSVSKLCLGAMMFGAWGNPDHDESIGIIHAALDAGINFIDTADVYGQGESEEIVGKALVGGRRDDVILATKFHNAMGNDPNQQGNSRRWIIRAVEDSLQRLGTDWIDLYQVHRPDPRTDIEETLSALTDLVHQGKVRYIGHSTFPASQIVEAQWTARDGHLQRFVTEQPPYSVLVRAVEAEVLPTCLRHGMAVMSYSSLANGWLSGRWRKDTGQQSSSRAARLPERFDLANPANQRKLEAVELLAKIADEAGITLIQLAIAFVLNHPAITTALIGPRTIEHLESQLTAAGVVLDEAILDRIDETVPPGTTINPADNSFDNPALEGTAARRAPAGGGRAGGRRWP